MAINYNQWPKYGFNNKNLIGIHIQEAFKKQKREKLSLVYFALILLS
ncbi:hypothetical protein [Niallia sp. Marseille-Q9988]